MSLFVEGWNVAYRNKNCGSILNDTSSTFKVIPNCWYGWCADPFVFEYQGKTYIFAELYNHIKGYAGIAYCVLKDNKFTKWKNIIQEPFHMSYPHIFERNGVVYMLPETSENERLILYKAKQFPDVWDKEEILLDDIKIVDTTLSSPSSSKTLGLTYKINENLKWELLLFQLENNKINFSELGAISNDDSIARPGGSFFDYQGRKFRVSQDCERDYGYALNFMEIISFSMKYFEEKKVKYVSPQDISIDKKIKVTGVHTYNATNNFEVVDVKSKDYNFVSFVFRIIRKVKRIVNGG